MGFIIGIAGYIALTALLINVFQEEIIYNDVHLFTGLLFGVLPFGITMYNLSHFFFTQSQRYMEYTKVYEQFFTLNKYCEGSVYLGMNCFTCCSHLCMAC